MKIYSALNYGSSSLKIAIFAVNKSNYELINKKNITSFDNIENAIEENINLFIDNKVDVFVHRVVHGLDYKNPFLINDETIKTLEYLAKINPLHNELALKGIKKLRSTFKEKLHYALFDTYFHNSIPSYAKVYGISLDFFRSGVKRYGFHGISYSYIVRKMKEILNKEKVDLIVLHLGAGCSICAIKENKSIETSMGFSPLEGLIMQKRSGDMDIGVVLHLIQNGFKPFDFYSKCGFTAMANVKNFIELEEKYKAGNDDAVLTMNAFVHRLVKYIGSYYVLLENLDGIVFTGGIGENSWLLRNLVCEKLKKIGIELNEEKNKNNELLISTSKSKINVFVIKTEEEEEMVRITAQQ